MKKQKLSVFIIIGLFAIIMLILIFYTAGCNEKAVYTSAGAMKFDTIILDAGHGGLDGGAVGLDKTEEKDINLQITIKLKSILELYGYKIILTRSNDDSIHDENAKTVRQQKVSDIHNREKIIKSYPDAIFISIHQNKFYDSSVSGAQVFYSKNNELSVNLAQNISSSIVTHIQPDNPRQIKKSGTEIYLLYHSQVPSVMVECGFLSNYNDLSKLKNDAFQKRLALAIAEGIVNYSKG
ncbi:MAG: N-acetylmuramoyl-L-alanine amidase [Clostridia bacterium]|nr:N-acetylmuramoyl-L-alanine amidase [Clostridia bacterium]